MSANITISIVIPSQFPLSILTYLIVFSVHIPIDFLPIIPS